MDKDKYWRTVCPDGVTFYAFPDNPRCIVDVDINDDVTTLKLSSQFNAKYYDLTTCKKSFPQIETIVIGKNVTIVEILNETFPNVKNVISESKAFRSGNVLIRNDNDFSGGYALLNTFCKKDGEKIDLKKVEIIRKNAFVGCDSANVINTGDVRFCNVGALSGYNAIDKLPLVDGARMLGPVMTSYSPVIPAATKTINPDIDFTGKSINVFDIKIIKNIAPEKMPESVYIDSTEAISPIEIYNVLNCNLKYVSINPDNPYYKSVDGVIYSSDLSYLIKCPSGRTGTFRMPNGVKTIGARAFMNAALSTVVISDSVVNIEEYAFSGSDIERVIFGRNVSYIGENMFSNCLNLKDIKIPPQIKKICREAFYSISPNTEIEFSEGIEEICSLAFRFNKKIGKSITLPSSIRKLEKLSLANATHVNVTTHDGMLPEGFFGAINSNRDDLKGGLFTYLTIDGQEFVIPSYNQCANEMDLYFKFLPFDPKCIWNMYKSISDTKQRVNFILSVYSDIHDEGIKNNIKTELKQMQQAIIKWLYKPERHDICSLEDKRKNLIKFLSLGVASVATLKKLITMCDDNDDVTMKAYALDMLNNSREKPNNTYTL